MGVHRWYSAAFGYSNYYKAAANYGGKPKLFISDHIQERWCGNPGHKDWTFRNSNHLDGQVAAGANAMMGAGWAAWYDADRFRDQHCMYWPNLKDAWCQLHGWGEAWPLGSGGSLSVGVPEGQSAPTQAEYFKMWGYRPVP